MDFDQPSLMLSGMLIGMVGLGFFIYGKKNADPLALLFGIALSVFPFFTHTMLALWGLTGLSSIGLYLTRRAT